MHIVTWLLTLLIILIGALFAALNAKSVQINYLIGTTEIPLPAVLLLALAIGILLSMLIMGISILKLTAKNKWLENKLKKAQEQLVHIQH